MGEALSGYETVKDVRGLGLLSGIEFQPPRKMLRLSFEAFGKIHHGMFVQVVVMRLFRRGFLMMHASTAYWSEALGLARRVLST